MRSKTRERFLLGKRSLRQRLLFETLRVACFHEVVRRSQVNS
ncbi:hypothetical protein [Nostoc sp. EfeVER01]|nr:hypothetical protein [Nostoc sp. EfeVER01]MDZ7948381.1 hypothetical protein [Nostoc sp. EfeVER01]